MKYRPPSQPHLILNLLGGRLTARVPKGSMKWGKPEWAAIPLKLMLGIILLAAGLGFLNDLFHGRSYIAAPAELSIPILLMKNPLLYRSVWPESSREASERFLMETLGRTQSEGRRRLGLAGGFRLLRSSGIDRLDAGRGSAGPDG
jgi:hypothetical protein